MTTPPFRIVFAIYPGMTQLDFTGPHQFLSRLPGAEVVLASPMGGDVPSEGLVFAGTVPLASVERADLICVPGGVNALDVAQDAAFLRDIARLAAGARYVTSVCTGSLILGAAGLLRGRRAACHWAWTDLLPLFGATPVHDRVVRDGELITGGGVTAGIDFALVVLAEIAGPDFAMAMQLGLEYAPAPPFDAGHPTRAPKAITAAYTARIAPLADLRRALAEAAAARLISPASSG